MKNSPRVWASVMTGIILSVSLAASAQKKAIGTAHATGIFDVKVTPQPPDEKIADLTISRFNIEKTFHGDLEGTSKAQMFATSTDVKGSGGYVAIERVTGTLAGRAGSFTLQHSGTMAHGTYHLDVNVVPDSGTGQLAGLTGSMSIQIAPDGKHSYDLAYTLPNTD
jgi:Protein of unknown function (DUF3224)